MFLFFSTTLTNLNVDLLFTASNCCQNLSPEEFIHVADALSILSSRLVHEDKKSAETACLALSRLAESYKNDKAKLKDIAKAGVLANLQKILVTGGGTVSSQTFVTVMHILVVMSSHGSEVGPLLLKENIGGTIRGLLVQQNKLNAEASTSSAAAAAAATSSAVIPIGEMELITRNPQELHEITSLIAELMPPLTAGIYFFISLCNNFPKPETILLLIIFLNTSMYYFCCRWNFRCGCSSCQTWSLHP